jgi:hypothetical protein
MNETVDGARRFVEALDLPDAGPQLETVPSAPVVAEGQSVVAVGSQLLEFDREFAPAARMPVANSLLLAQLAANKAASQSKDVLAWYEKYNEVLQGIGWQVGDFSMVEQSVNDKNASLHEQIVPTLTAMLGPVASVSLAIAVLQGLGQMDEESPWVRLFDRSSQHSSGAKFQVAYIAADGNGDPQVRSACFALEARKAVTQVLFFKFSSGRATLKSANAALGVSRPLLEATEKQIEARVQSFVSDFIANVPI